jgi:hypothetical protein
LLTLSPAHAALVSFTTGAKLSGDSTTAAFAGTIELTSATASGGTLVISLTNQSLASNGGYITAIAFNNPGPISPLSVSLATTSGLDNLLGGSSFSNGVDAKPAKPFDIGAGVGTSWLGGGSPTGGIGVGQTGTLTFTLTGNLAGLTTQSFVDTLNKADGEWLAVRFKGFKDGGSSKYGTSVVPIPAAVWLLGSGLLGLAGLGRLRRSAA